METKKLKKKARQKLTGKYITTIAALLIYSLIGGLFVGTSKLIYNENMYIFFNIIITGLLYMGLLQIFIKVARGKKTSVKDLFSRTDLFWKCTAITIVLTVFSTICIALEYIAYKSLAVFILYQPDMSLAICASMTILGVVICAAIATFYVVMMASFSQVYYILYENENMPVTEIFEKSMDLMEKHKIDYILFQLSFLLWIILGLFTFGLLYLWLIPYMGVAEVNFYDEIKKLEKKQK